MLHIHLIHPTQKGLKEVHYTAPKDRPELFRASCKNQRLYF